MSTYILPHNPLEVLDAMAASLKGESYQLYPEFLGGGIGDVEDYRDGRGSVSGRAKLNTSNPKRIIIEEPPYGSTTDATIR